MKLHLLFIQSVPYYLFIEIILDAIQELLSKFKEPQIISAANSSELHSIDIMSKLPYEKPAIDFVTCQWLYQLDEGSTRSSGVNCESFFS